MSSASLGEKRALRKSQSRIVTSSTSITSAPPTTSDSKKHDSDQRSAREKSMRSKQRDSLPELCRVKKGSRSVRASNFELSSSANDFESTTNHHDRQSATKAASVVAAANPAKQRSTAVSNAGKSEPKNTDDKVMDLLKKDSMAQENYKLVYVCDLQRVFV